MLKSTGSVKAIVLVGVLAVLGGAIFLAKDSLPFGFTAIADIEGHPSSYEGVQVKIKGQVVDTLKIPFVDSKSYVLNDGTGKVTVSTTGSLPVEGTKIAILAEGNSRAIIGGESLGFRLQELKVLPQTALLLD